MKIFRDKEKLKIAFNRRERDLFLWLISSYPVKEEKVRSLSTRPEFKEANELLKHSLDEQKSIHRLLLGQIGKQAADAVKERQTVIELDLAQAEGLLQILNEIRLGHWEKLGSPTLKDLRGRSLDSESAKSAAALELAGHFQIAIIEARLG